MSLKERVAKDTLWYTGSVYIAQFLGIFSGIATRKFLGPDDMGLWVLFQTFLTYGLFSEMGIFTAMYCKIPALVGKKEGTVAVETRNVAFSFAFANALFVTVLFFIYGLLSAPRDARQWCGWVVTAILIMITIIYNFYISCCWALNRFKELSVTVVLNAVLTLILVFWIVRAWGFYGAFACTLTVTTFSAVILSSRLKIQPKWLWDWKRVKSLLWFGFPIFASGMFFTLFSSLDRMIIAKYFNTQTLGYYSIAIIVFSFSSAAPKMLSIVLFPRIQEEYAASQNMSQLTKMVVVPDLIIAFFSPLILAITCFLLPPAVQSLLPKYVPGIFSAQLLLVGSFFISLVYNSQSFLIAINKRAHAIPFLLFSIGILMLASAAFIRSGYGIAGIAASVSVAFFSYFATLTFYVLRHQLKPREMLGYYLKVCAIFLYFMACVWWLNRQTYSLNPWVQAAAQCILIALASAPMMYWGDRCTHALRYSFYLMKKGLV